MIEGAIEGLIKYALEKELIKQEDVIYTRNRILALLELEKYEQAQWENGDGLEAILKNMLDYATEKGLIEDSVVYRDLFDTKIMGLVVPRPSWVIERFWSLYEVSPKKATQWYYDFSQNTDYIRRYRIEKDQKWVTQTEYGPLDITINLSKPEKDPKAIAAAKNAVQRGYPKCQLCKENEGFAGHINHPARENHRMIPITMAGGKWYFQYSPYVYYNEHCIALNAEHIPMVIDKKTFEKLFDFIKCFPHYFIGSNADLPIVGGSILSHDHFQGGNYEFAMANAPIEKNYVIKDFEDVEVGRVKWPMSVVRIRHKSSERLIALGEKILQKWRNYTDEEAFIFARTKEEQHSTITPIARKRGDAFELDLVLRNNITTEEHPLGLYHPHENLHHIKKENIGLIEVMGLAVLPARLKEELEAVQEAIVKGKDLKECEKTAKHAQWAEAFLKKYDNVTEENVSWIVQKEVGMVFEQVLTDAGVFKRNEKGLAYFDKFMAHLNE